MESQKKSGFGFWQHWGHFNMAKLCYGVLENWISGALWSSLFSENISSYDTVPMKFLGWISHWIKEQYVLNHGISLQTANTTINKIQIHTEEQNQTLQKISHEIILERDTIILIYKESLNLRESEKNILWTYRSTFTCVLAIKLYNKQQWHVVKAIS